MNLSRYIYTSVYLIHVIVSCITPIFLSVKNSSAETDLFGMGKKSKKTTMPTASPDAGQSIVDSGSKKKGLISDTMCLGLTRATWQGTYNLIEAEEPKVTGIQVSFDSTSKSEANLKDLANSFLHKIAAREQILPYTDVVRWEIQEIPITDRTFSTIDGRIFGSFRAEDLRQMYHLPAEEKKYNMAFLEKF